MKTVIIYTLFLRTYRIFFYKAAKHNVLHLLFKIIPENITLTRIKDHHHDNLPLNEHDLWVKLKVVAATFATSNIGQLTETIKSSPLL